MAHELNIQDGQAAMFYLGQTPWHGLGTHLQKPATAAEAIKAARLDWEVIKEPVYLIHGLQARSVPDRFAVVRKDLYGEPDCPVFGIVGRGYTPLQNHEAFEFFDPIVGKNAAIYHTAGALGDGERVWILAKLPSQIQVVGDDIADKYLLLSNSHDGGSSVQIKFTPIRVVCQNTLTMALSSGPVLRVAHKPDLHQRLKQADRLLNLIDVRYEELGQSFADMTKVQMPSPRLLEYFNLVFPDPSDKEDERAIQRVEQNRSEAEHFFSNGRGNQMKGVRGTLWAAYNGVTEFIDYHQTKQTAERRLDSIWFGSGYLTKARAFRIAENKLQEWLM